MNAQELRPPSMNMCVSLSNLYFHADKSQRGMACLSCDEGGGMEHGRSLYWVGMSDLHSLLFIQSHRRGRMTLKYFIDWLKLCMYKNPGTRRHYSQMWHFAAINATGELCTICVTPMNAATAVWKPFVLKPLFSTLHHTNPSLNVSNCYPS